MRCIYKIDTPQAMDVDEEMYTKMIATGEWVSNPAMRGIKKENVKKVRVKKELDNDADNKNV